MVNNEQRNLFRSEEDKNEPLYFFNPNDDTVNVGLNSSDSTTLVYYSRDAESWFTINAGGYVTVAKNQRVYFYCNGWTSTGVNRSFFTTGSIECHGNVASMTHGLNFKGNPVMSASAVPRGMFYGTYITTAPYIPYTVAYNYCFYQMFYSCRRLTESPEILLDSLTSGQAGDYCCYQMFTSCESIKYPPSTIYLRTVGLYAFYQMFGGCSSMLKAPKILTETCGDYAFCLFCTYCTSMYYVPEILALTTIGTGGCKEMFYYCSSLIKLKWTAETTPYTETSTTNEYFYQMFAGCHAMTALHFNTLCTPTKSGNGFISTDVASNWINALIGFIGSNYKGTFIRSRNATWDRCEVIPHMWRVVDEDDYDEDMYLHFKALTAGTVIGIRALSSTYSSSAYYSYDGYNWISFSPMSNPTFTLTNVGDKIYFKNINDRPNWQFTTSVDVECHGNVQSLIWGDEFWILESVPYNNAFEYLFKDTKITTAPCLMATSTTGNYIYKNMFTNCTSLFKAPIIPMATNGTCVGTMLEMFKGCTSMLLPPNFLILDYANQDCYNGMFYGCTSLLFGPDISTSSFGTRAMYLMFYGCTSMIRLPQLTFSEFASGCQSSFEGMFYNCSTINDVKIIGDFSFGTRHYMFKDLFSGCSNISHIKVYNLEVPTPSSDNWTNWLNTGSTSSAVYMTSPNATWTTSTITRSASGVPSNFSFGNTNYLCFRSLTDGTTLKLGCYSALNTTSEVNSPSDSLTVYYSLNSPSNWTTYVTASAKSPTLTLSAGDIVFFKCGSASSPATMTVGTVGSGPDYAFSSSNRRHFVSNNSIEAHGNLLSLGYGDDCDTATTIPAVGDYAYMFFACHLTTAPEIPATTLTAYCYSGLFDLCLFVLPPELPATNLAIACYNNLFYICRLLIVAPILPDYDTSTALPERAYLTMYASCDSLKYVPDIYAFTVGRRTLFGMFRACVSLEEAPHTVCRYASGGMAMDAMFSGCTSLKKAHSLQIVYNTTSGYNFYLMFNGCTSLEVGPKEVPLTTAALYDYYQMFNGCSKLKTPPKMFPTSWTAHCFDQMFKGCSSLNYIKIFFTNTLSSTYASDWLNGVASSGNFVEYTSSTLNIGTSGVPSGWTVSVENTQF